MAVSTESAQRETAMNVNGEEENVARSAWTGPVRGQPKRRHLDIVHNGSADTNRCKSVGCARGGMAVRTVRTQRDLTKESGWRSGRLKRGSQLQAGKARGYDRGRMEMVTLSARCEREIQLASLTGEEDAGRNCKRQRRQRVPE